MNDASLGPIMMDLQGLQVSEQESAWLQHPSVGGLILFTRNYQNPAQLAALIRSVRALRPQLLIAADTEGGRVQRFRAGFIKHPAAARYGELWERDAGAAVAAARAGGWLLAAELRALDLDLAFAPVLDIDTGVSSVIADRAFSVRQAAVNELTPAFAQGMQAAGMATTGKHFPGHGFVAPDSHLELPEDSRDEGEILSQDVVPYQVLAERLDSVMMAHVRYRAVDDKPASISAVWIQQCLRDQLGFRGAVFSDDLSMGGLSSYGDVRERCALALKAGCDMLPVCNRPQDLARLLDGQHWQASAGAAQRLQVLRRPRRWTSLEELRETEEYRRNFNILNNLIEVKVEQ